MPALSLIFNGELLATSAVPLEAFSSVIFDSGCISAELSAGDFGMVSLGVSIKVGRGLPDRIVSVSIDSSNLADESADGFGVVTVLRAGLLSAVSARRLAASFSALNVASTSEELDISDQICDAF